MFLCVDFSGLDNDMGGPAAVTPPKEGKQKNASKKEVRKLEGDISDYNFFYFFLKCIHFRLSPEDSKCLPVIWKKRFTIALPMR